MYGSSKLQFAFWQEYKFNVDNAMVRTEWDKIETPKRFIDIGYYKLLQAVAGD